MQNFIFVSVFLTMSVFLFGQSAKEKEKIAEEKMCALY